MSKTFHVDASQFEMHFDANDAIAFARQLEAIDAKQYDVKRAQLEAFELVPTKTDIHEGAETYTYRQYDQLGVAEISSNYARGAPRADVKGQEFTSRIKSVRIGYGYNVQEMRAARMAGRPLEEGRANAARRGLNEKINDVALLGDAEHGLIGLFNLPNTQTYTVPNGTGGSALWADKTSAEILADLFGMIDQVPTQTNEVERVTRLVLPHSRLRLITRKALSPDNPQTILQALLESRPGLEVRGALGLETAGAGGTARMMGYRPDPEVLELILPIPFEQFPPERHGMEYTIDMHARTGGVVCRYPLAVIYGDGI